MPRPSRRNGPGKVPAPAAPAAPPAFPGLVADPLPPPPTPRTRSPLRGLPLRLLGPSRFPLLRGPRSGDVGPLADDPLPRKLLHLLHRKAEQPAEHLLVVVPHRPGGPLDPAGTRGELRAWSELVDPSV